MLSYFIWNKSITRTTLQDVPIARMSFQHDGALAHFSIDERTYLNATFGVGWIRRGGAVPWPPRFIELRLFFLWTSEASCFCDSDEDLVDRNYEKVLPVCMK
ncbi:hypothetical protein TNCV_4153461 [Trichonephila clavipes]|nr:hypothetical protein TNCV_4153461 [Trichonephila clavipes]